MWKAKRFTKFVEGTLMKRKRKTMRTALIVLSGLCIMACGGQTPTGTREEETRAIALMEEEAEQTEDNGTAENGAEPTEKGMAEEAREKIIIEGAADEDRNEPAAEGTVKEQGAGQPGEDDVITAYVTEDIEYSDKIMTVRYVDDLSLLEDMKYTDSTYVYRDGKVYYRRYHEDSYEEAALWGNYAPVSGKEKEIVCIDGDGLETVLFTDEGYGDIYLLDDRFYMTEIKTEKEDEAVYNREWLYSVDMRGKDRIDYGYGSIFAIDRERKILILKMAGEEGICYYVLDYESGEKKWILSDGEEAYFHHVEMYQDGWLYYVKVERFDVGVLELWAVSLEGEQRKIIALTSEINQRPSGYMEHIINMKADGERLFFIIGGYDGSAAVFQGGKLISIRQDGTDYKAVETPGDTYYVSHDRGKTFLYFPGHYRPFAEDVQECDTMIWDVDGDICYLSGFPQRILLEYDRQVSRIWNYCSGNKGVLCEMSLYYDDINEKEVDIYAVFDDSGQIVRAASKLNTRIAGYEGEEVDRVQYKDLYYADGFLYFRVEYSAYDEGSSIGWRDGYRRLRSDVYRLKTGESMAGLLYSY